jgi:fucose 4-O-acetylase-like acetyltransferase
MSTTVPAVANALGIAFDYIYSFHVPLFFLLAGLTFSTRKSFSEFAKVKFLRLMVPYFVWGIVSATLFIALGKVAVRNMESVEFSSRALSSSWWAPLLSIAHGGGWPGGKGFRFNGVLWFLPVLFSAELIYYPIAKRISKTWHFAVIASVVAVILSPFYWPFLKLLLPYGLCRVPEYLVFILIGDWIGRTISLKPSDSELKTSNFNFKSLSPWLTLAVSLLLAAYLCVKCGELVRYPLIVPKAFATIVPLLLIARFRIFKWFGVLAPHALAIMIFHKFILVPMQIGVTRSGMMKQYPASAAVLCLLLFSVVCVCMCYVISRILIRWLPWTIGEKRVLAK